MKSVKKRSLQLVVACVFVTGSSYFIAPTKMTIFGILHLILLSSLLVLLFVNRPNLALIVGLLVFIAGHIFQFAALDSLWLHWFGMVENKRPALDYVPLFPWFGVVLMGVFLGRLMLQHQSLNSLAQADLSQSSPSFARGFHRLLIKSGQHSLIIYLVHQPVMFAGFYLIEMF